MQQPAMDGSGMCIADFAVFGVWVNTMPRYQTPHDQMDSAKAEH